MKRENVFVVGMVIFTLMAGALCPAATVKDYSGQELDAKDFKDASLNGAKFDGASLKGANFKNATCKNASFRDAKLQGADFRDANLEGADFTGAQLKEAKFHNTKAWHANLAGAEIYLAGAVFVDYSKIKDYRAQQTLMANAEYDSGTLSFHYADLHKAVIVGNAKDVDFRDADLRGADLSKVTNLKDARLGKAKYDEKTKWTIDPKEAGAEFVPTTAKAAEPAAATSPLVGKWLILKGEGDAPDNGVLRILADHTFQWDPALSADKPILLSGKWSEAGDGVELKGGELGQTWSAGLATQQGKTELHLTSGNGVKRVAVLEEAKANASKSPLVGKWLILKGEEGVLDNGVLRIFADHTFEWDPALSADKPNLLSGKWSEAGEAIEIKGGELGQTWNAGLVTRLGKSEMHLTSTNGAKRVGVPE